MQSPLRRSFCENQIFQVVWLHVTMSPPGKPAIPAGTTPVGAPAEVGDGPGAIEGATPGGRPGPEAGAL